MKKGQSTLHLIISASALIGSVAAPILYVGDIKTHVAVIEQRTTTLEENYRDLNTDLSNVKADTGATKAYVEALLPRQGINPRSIWDNGTTTALR